MAERDRVVQDGACPQRGFDAIVISRPDPGGAVVGGRRGSCCWGNHLGGCACVMLARFALHEARHAALQKESEAPG